MDYFEEVIGQSSVKNRLNFLLNGFKRTNIVSHLLFSGAKGLGKSHVARLTAKNLHGIRKVEGKKKPMVEVNGTTLKSIKMLCEEVLMPHCIGNDEFTIFIDEVHEINSKVAGFLLSVLNPTSTNKNVVAYEGNEITIDFKKISFMMATTETHRIFEPLRDRLTEIALVDYTVEDLARIIKLNIGSFESEHEAILQTASFCKSNARSAAKMGKEVETYCAGQGILTYKNKDVLPLIHILDLYPLGLNRNEVNSLRYIAEEEQSSLKTLCSKSGLTAHAQQDIEKILLKFGLMTIDGKRSVTRKGKEYLKNIENWENK